VACTTRPDPALGVPALTPNETAGTNVQEVAAIVKSGPSRTMVPRLRRQLPLLG
jgi:hypothetical protein